MKTKRFDFIFKPLLVSYTMVIDNSVSDRQNYDADTGEYTPDYTLTPLGLLPQVSIIDKDGYLEAGNVNAQLTNIKWYEIIDGVSTQILTTSTDYTITLDGTSNNGRLLVGKNVEQGQHVTLQFYAEYVDSRTGQIYVIQMTYLLTCANGTEGTPELTLNALDQSIYNPLRDGSTTQTITATLKVGGKEVVEANREFVWQKMDEDGAWNEVGNDELLDYDVTVSDDGASVTVDKDLMGEALHLKCLARYDSDGNPSSVELSDESPQVIISFIRRIAKLDYDFTGVPTNIPTGTLRIYPEAIIEDAMGVIDNDTVVKEMVILWYIATNKASGSLSYTQIADGATPTIPTDAMDENYGAVVGMDLVDRGGTAALVDDEDNILVDDSDNVLLIK